MPRKPSKSKINKYVQERNNGKSLEESAKLAELSIDYVTEIFASQFYESVLARFKDCGSNRLKIMELFYELIFDCKDDYEKLIALRDAYNEALDSIDEPTNRALLIRYATSFKCKINQPRDIDNWSKDRLLEHIVYHLARHLGYSNPEALIFCMKPIEEKEAWLNEHKS